jgi:catechol 2,3-dioxygenase-like lactoylglutathione lyase family enzyme
MIESIEHTGLSVANLERSIAFYCDMLGFTLKRIVESPPEMRLGDVIGLPGAAARIAHVQLGGVMLELFEYQEPRGRRIPPDRSQADLGFIHLGLRSTDTRADYARLVARGVQFIHDPIEFRPGVWIAYFHGPDGEVCEIRQS